MKYVWCSIIICVYITLMLAGCGETIHGVSEDVHRIGRGVKTIFVSE